MKWVGTLALALCAIALTARASGEADYPERAIHLVVGFPSGSQPDLVARLVAGRLSERLKRPVVVENLAGAAGNIAADHVAKAAPDGYTIGLLSQTQLAVNPALYQLPYEPTRDFAAISQIVVSPQMLVVHSAVPARTVNELTALAKAHPGTLTFASSGTGSGSHIAGELFKSTAAIDIRHIPYKGVVAAIPDLLAGRITMMFSPIPVVMPLVREGKLRALAVTSLTRSAAAPDVPALAESGYPGFEATNWYGLLAPAATPAWAVGRLHAETVKVLAETQLHEQLTELGLDVIGNSPRDFSQAIQAEIPKWKQVVKASGIKTE